MSRTKPEWRRSITNLVTCGSCATCRGPSARSLLPHRREPGIRADGSSGPAAVRARGSRIPLPPPRPGRGPHGSRPAPLAGPRPTHRGPAAGSARRCGGARVPSLAAGAATDAQRRARPTGCRVAAGRGGSDDRTAGAGGGCPPRGGPPGGGVAGPGGGPPGPRVRAPVLAARQGKPRGTERGRPPGAPFVSARRRRHAPKAF